MINVRPPIEMIQRLVGIDSELQAWHELTPRHYGRPSLQSSLQILFLILQPVGVSYEKNYRFI